MRGVVGVLGVVTVILCLGACNANLVNVRQQNATLVLQKYRARPLSAIHGNAEELTINDCIRLAIQYNLDIQTQIWDEQVKKSLAKSDLLRMFPRMEGKYEVTQRDRPAFSRSDVLNQEGAYEVTGPGAGTGVTNFSTGRERFARSWNAQLKWSPVDAAMARYNWRIKKNEATYARYQRVRVAQQLIGTVGAAFYRLVALGESAAKAKALVENRESIVEDLRALVKDRLVTNEEYLDAAALLAQAKGQLAGIYVDIRRQRELLASSMNVSPDSCFRVAGGLFPILSNRPRSMQTRSRRTGQQA